LAGGEQMTNLTMVDWSKIPTPSDDGGASHLIGVKLPAIALLATSGEQIDLSRFKGRTVVYAYPMTGQPGVPLPDGWDMVPGARGCTPQSCAFRDHAEELRSAGAQAIFGLSTQASAYQAEAAERLHLPFSLLSDEDLSLANALNLPTFAVDDMTLLKRLTLVIHDGQIEHVFYPIFPPDTNAAVVIAWLVENPLNAM
jgi:peroxiredoxin